MNTEPTTFYVAMKMTEDGSKLACIPVYDPVTCNDFYAYTSRRWAEKHASKHGGEVYSVQGFDCEVEGHRSWLIKTNMSYKHDAIREEAERMFN